VTQLIAPNSQIEACALNMPETVFFEDSKISEIIKTEQESGSLVAIRTEYRLLPETVRTNFVQAVRERRQFVNRAKIQAVIANDIAEAGITEKPQDERSFAVADFAIFRHMYDPYVNAHTAQNTRKEPIDRIVNEAEFSKFFDGIKQEKKDIIASIECIQTCVKSKIGLGRHIPVHFRAELDITQENKI
jgi:hypothetical protein